MLKDIVQLTPAQRTGRILQWGGYGVVRCYQLWSEPGYHGNRGCSIASNTQDPQATETIKTNTPPAP